ncbi:hypothetical protein C8Q76DRAFT_416855 [Earliella scabrosa]|nr:hypothetical protein C8Q76DRAFT_416855 [Earliella scabrosa]
MRSMGHMRRPAVARVLHKAGGTPLDGKPTETIACFIPSEAGKNFALHHGNELTGGRDVYLRCEVSMDGAPTTSIYSPMGHEWCRDGQRIDPTTRLAFQFAPLETTDDDDATLTKERDVSDLGTIKIRCVRVRQVKLPFTQPKPQRYGRFREVGPVHERSKRRGRIGSRWESRSSGVQATGERKVRPYRPQRRCYRSLRLPVQTAGCVRPPLSCTCGRFTQARHRSMLHTCMRGPLNSTTPSTRHRAAPSSSLCVSIIRFIPSGTVASQTVDCQPSR